MTSRNSEQSSNGRVRYNIRLVYPSWYTRSDPEIDLQVPYTLVQRSHWCKRASVSFDAGLTLRSLFGVTVLQVSACCHCL